jgi:hypothetical protein
VGKQSIAATKDDRLDHEAARCADFKNLLKRDACGHSPSVPAQQTRGNAR